MQPSWPASTTRSLLAQSPSSTRAVSSGVRSSLMSSSSRTSQIWTPASSSTSSFRLFLPGEKLMRRTAPRPVWMFLLWRRRHVIGVTIVS